MSVKPGEGYCPEMPVKDPDAGKPLEPMGHLVRTVEAGEGFRIGDVEFFIVWIKGHRAKVTFKAPKRLKIDRC